MQQDLNDLFFFVQVVEKAGFSTASRALGIPKSRLSRRISLLEERLKVRLLQRSARGVTVTDIGQVYLRHCQAMLLEAQAAQDAIDSIRAEPRGQVRVSCPWILSQTLIAELLPEFMLAHPKVSLHFDVTNRRVDVIQEGFDVALRVRSAIEDSALIVRTFGQSRRSLVASPALLQGQGGIETPEALLRYPSLSSTHYDGRYVWEMTCPGRQDCRISYTPRLISEDVQALRKAAIAGIGIVVLPDYLCRDDYSSGRLARVLPQWSLPPANIHAVLPSRRGLVPAVRQFVDFLAVRLPEKIAENELDVCEQPQSLSLDSNPR